MHKINAKTKICMIIGDPVEHSLSPAMHNAAYEHLQIESEFVFTAATVGADNIQAAIEAAKTLGIRGITCTMPHKESVMQYLDKIDEHAAKIGAVNTVLNNKGALIGYNTDWLGVLAPLKALGDLTGKKAVILGAGGAARAMIYALQSAGATVRLLNRTLDSAQQLAEEFNLAGIGQLSEVAKIADADIVLNATSVGMQAHQSPIDLSAINSSQIVFEAIYKPHKTALVQRAEQIGAAVVYGYEMLLHQGTAQFEIYTGQKAPVDIMKDVLLNNLS